MAQEGAADFAGLTPVAGAGCAAVGEKSRTWRLWNAAAAGANATGNESLVVLQGTLSCSSERHRTVNVYLIARRKIGEDMSKQTKQTLRAGLPVVLAVAVLTGAALFLSSNMLDAGAAAPVADEKAAAYKPVVKLDAIMDVVGEFYEDLEEQLKKKKFRPLRKRSIFLAEMMNLAIYFDHSEYNKAKGWEELAGKNRDLLLEAAKIAKKKDADALAAALEKIEAACEACHEKYRD